MGNTNNGSTRKFDAITSKQFYGGLDRNYAGEGFTGAKDTKDYGAGIMSNAKRVMIRDIADILGSKMGIKELRQTKDVDELIKLMKQYVPDPRRDGNGITFSGDKQKQIKACEVLVGAIKEKFGLDITATTPEGICAEVSGVVYSLFSNMSSELLVTRKDLENNISNLETMKSFLDLQYGKIEEAIISDNDSSIGAETKMLRDVRKDINDEYKRQMQMLKNMLDLLQVKTMNLNEVMEEGKQFKYLVQKIRMYPGTKEFGRKLSYTLSGLRTAAQAAKIVDAALKEVGASYTEYTKAVEYKDLEKLISDKTVSVINKKGINLEKLIKANQALFRFQYMHDEIVKELVGNSKPAEFVKSMRSSKSVGGYLDEEDGNLLGAYEGGGLDKRIKNRNELKKKLVEEFNRSLNIIVAEISRSAKKISSALSAGKHLTSDKVRKFVESLRLVPDLSKEFTYFSITGIMDKIEYRQERERFVASLKYVIACSDDLLKDALDLKDSVGEVKLLFQKIIELIEAYTRRFADGLGSVVKRSQSSDVVEGSSEFAASQMEAEGGNDIDEEIRSLSLVLGGKEKRNYFGSNESLITGGGINAQIARTAMNFTDVIDTIFYFHRIGLIRHNLKHVNTELISYKEDYSKMLGDAVANGIDSVVKERKDLEYLDNLENAGNDAKSFIKALEPTAKAVAAPVSPSPFIAVPNAIPGDAEKKAIQEKVKGFYHSQMTAKVNMYRVAEAVDIYLAEFTDGITSDLDSIQDILQMLNNTETISNWFNNSSGDYICQMFERFPGFVSSSQEYLYPPNRYFSDYKPEDDYHYYLSVLRKCNLLNTAEAKSRKAESTILHHNKPEMDKYIAKLDTRDTKLKTPTRSIKATADTDILPYRFPGNPYISLPICALMETDRNKKRDVISALSDAKNALSVNGLKNIIAAFVTVGERFGGKNIIKKSPIPPKLILKYLNDYIANSAFSSGSYKDGSVLSKELPLVKGIYDLKKLNIKLASDNTTFTANGENIWTGMNTNLRYAPVGGGLPADANVVPHAYGGRVYSKMRSVPQVKADGDNENDDNISPTFVQTDKLFTHVIKAIVAKIFTVIGTFNMLTKPVQSSGLSLYKEPRMILGGSDDPIVLPEALELYVRLPLLAEFYKDIFEFDAVGNNRMITLVPEIDGIFSGLVNIIFERAKNVKEGNYSDSDIRMLIEEINKIYLRFKNSKTSVTDVFDAFKNEINRRFGVLKDEERKEYQKFIKNRYNNDFDKEKDVIDFEINGIDEEDTFRRPAPSDSFLSENFNTKTIGQFNGHKYNLDSDADYTLIHSFRKKIDNKFRKVHNAILENENSEVAKVRHISFYPLIKNYGEELKYAKTENDKYHIVKSALSSLGSFSVSSLEKAYIAYHETVITGLNTLYALYQQLKKYNDTVKDMHKSIHDITEWSKTADCTADIYNATSISTGGTIYTGVGGNAHGVPIGAATRNSTDTLKNKLAPLTYAKKLGGATQAATILVPESEQGIKTNVGNRGNGGFADITNGNTDFSTAGARVSFIAQFAGYIASKYNAADLSAVIGTSPFNHTALDPHYQEVVQRFFVDQDAILRDLFDLITQIQDNFGDLVTVRIDAYKDTDTVVIKPAPADPDEITYGERKMRMFIDHTNMRDKVKASLNVIKQMNDKFRGLISESIIKDFESSDKPGSIYYLEKHLCDEILDGKFPSDVPVEDSKSIDDRNKQINEILEFLTRKWKVGGASLDYIMEDITSTETDRAIVNKPQEYHTVLKLGAAVPTEASANEDFPCKLVDLKDGSYHSFYRTMSSILVYDFRSLNSGIDVGLGKIALLGGGVIWNGLTSSENVFKDKNSMKGIDKLVYNHGQKKYDMVEPGAPYFPGLTQSDLFFHEKTWYSPTDEGFDFARNQASNGLVLQFNRLVGLYLANIYDETTTSFYLPTIDKFANGAFNDAVVGTRSFEPFKLLDASSGQFKISGGGVINPIVSNNSTFSVVAHRFIDFGYDSANLSSNSSRGVLVTPLAKIIRSMISIKSGNLNEQLFAKSDLSLIPNYMKEKMRAYFPVFHLLFKNLTKRCELYKLFASCLNVKNYNLARIQTKALESSFTGITGAGFRVALPITSQEAQVTRLNATTVITAINDANIYTAGARYTSSSTLVQLPNGSDEMSAYMIHAAGEVIKGCNSLIGCIQDVLKDLSENPKLGETYNTFIQDYSNINGYPPFMPQSTTLHLLTADDDKISHFYPTERLGGFYFKLAYYTRSLLSGKMSMESMPGMMQILKEHNSSCDVKHHISDAEYKRFQEYVLPLLTFSFTNKIFKRSSLIAKDDGAAVMNPGVAVAIAATVGGRDQLVDLVIQENKTGGGTATTMHVFHNTADFRVDNRDLSNPPSLLEIKNTEGKWVYQAREKATITDIMELTESTSQRRQRLLVSNYVEQSKSKGIMRSTREDKLVYNIIDLNITPVNIHALMRDIPLVNVYNYSITYDSMIQDIFGSVETTTSIKTYSATNTPRQVFTKLLLEPYNSMDETAYEFYIGRIMRGALGIEGLGMPKYLSEEIYNKSLFGELVNNHVNFSAEPSVDLSHAHEMGKREAPADDITQIVEPVYQLVKKLSEPFAAILTDNRVNVPITTHIQQKYIFSAAATESTATASDCYAGVVPFTDAPLKNLVANAIKSPGNKNQACRQYFTDMFKEKMKNYKEYVLSRMDHFESDAGRINPNSVGSTADDGRACNFILDHLPDGLKHHEGSALTNIFEEVILRELVVAGLSVYAVEVGNRAGRGLASPGDFYGMAAHMHLSAGAAVGDLNIQFSTGGLAGGGTAQFTAANTAAVVNAAGKNIYTKIGLKPIRRAIREIPSHTLAKGLTLATGSEDKFFSTPNVLPILIRKTAATSVFNEADLGYEVPCRHLLDLYAKTLFPSRSNYTSAGVPAVFKLRSSPLYSGIATTARARAVNISGLSADDRYRLAVSAFCFLHNTPEGRKKMTDKYKSVINNIEAKIIKNYLYKQTHVLFPGKLMYYWLFSSFAACTIAPAAKLYYENERRKNTTQRDKYKSYLRNAIISPFLLGLTSSENTAPAALAAAIIVATGGGAPVTSAQIAADLASTFKCYDSVNNNLQMEVADTKAAAPSAYKIPLNPLCLQGAPGVWSNGVVPFELNGRTLLDHVFIDTGLGLNTAPISDKTEATCDFNGFALLERFNKGTLLPTYDAAIAAGVAVELVSKALNSIDAFGNAAEGVVATVVKTDTPAITSLMGKCTETVLADAAAPTVLKPIYDWLDDVNTNSLNFGTKRRSNREMVNNLFPQYFNEHLHYLARDASGATQIYEIPLKPGAIDILKLYGKMRFDTKFIRNIFWITNIQRVLRFKLRRDLTWYNSKVVSDHAVIAPSITESYEKDLHQVINMQNYKY